MLEAHYETKGRIVRAVKMNKDRGIRIDWPTHNNQINKEAAGAAPTIQGVMFLVE